MKLLKNQFEFLLENHKEILWIFVSGMIFSIMISKLVSIILAICTVVYLLKDIVKSKIVSEDENNQ